MTVLRLFLGFILPLAAVGPATADPVTVEGITFSDEMGNFKLVSVTGTGSMEDPFVVREEITGPGDPILVIKDFTRDFGNRVGTQHAAAFAMVKIVVNKTGRSWHGFQIELREVESRPSSYEDGLSFGQASIIADQYVGSSLLHSQRLDEPEDSLGFGGESIQPGAEVTFRFVVSDMSPWYQFFVVQRLQQPLS